VLSRGGNESSFGDHVNQERIFSIYMDREGGDSLTTSFEEEQTENSPFQGQVIGEEVTKDVFGNGWGGGFSRCLGMEVVGWVARGKTGEARLCSICNHLHG
jgi:hypothetical protein